MPCRSNPSPKRQTRDGSPSTIARVGGEGGLHRGEGRGVLAGLAPPGLDPCGGDQDVGVENLAGAWVHVGGADGVDRPVGHGPADGRVARVGRAVDRIVGSVERLHGAAEARLLEGAVPLQDAGADVGPPFERHAVIDVEGDRADRLARRGARLTLFQPPPVHVAHEEALRGVPGEILEGGDEVSHPLVGVARPHRGGGQLEQRVVHPDGDRAVIRDRLQPEVAGSLKRQPDLGLEVGRKEAKILEAGALVVEGDGGRRSSAGWRRAEAWIPRRPNPTPGTASGPPAPRSHPGRAPSRSETSAPPSARTSSPPRGPWASRARRRTAGSPPRARPGRPGGGSEPGRSGWWRRRRGRARRVPGRAGSPAGSRDRAAPASTPRSTWSRL